MTSFEAACKLLNKEYNLKSKVEDKMSLFFVDYEFIPLLVQENYLSSYLQSSNQIQTIVDLCHASQHIV